MHCAVFKIALIRSLQNLNYISMKEALLCKLCLKKSHFALQIKLNPFRIELKTNVGVMRELDGEKVA